MMNKFPASFVKHLKVQPNGCWFWSGPRRGYHPIYVSACEGIHRQPAFQFAWVLENGPVPKGYGLYVGCRGIACANPEHRVLLPEKQGRARTASRRASVRKKREAREFFAAEAKRLGLDCTKSNV